MLLAPLSTLSWRSLLALLAHLAIANFLDVLLTFSILWFFTAGSNLDSHNLIKDPWGVRWSWPLPLDVLLPLYSSRVSRGTASRQQLRTSTMGFCS